MTATNQSRRTIATHRITIWDIRDGITIWDVRDGKEAPIRTGDYIITDVPGSDTAQVYHIEEWDTERRRFKARTATMKEARAAQRKPAGVIQYASRPLVMRVPLAAGS